MKVPVEGASRGVHGITGVVGGVANAGSGGGGGGGGGSCSSGSSDTAHTRAVNNTETWVHWGRRTCRSVRQRHTIIAPVQ